VNDKNFRGHSQDKFCKERDNKMSYGDVYISRDMKELEKVSLKRSYSEGISRTAAMKRIPAEVDAIIIERIQTRYPDITNKQAKQIVSNIRRYRSGRWDRVLGNKLK